MENIARKGYAEILKTLRKYKDVCVVDILAFERKAKHHLFGIKLKEEFGLNINPKEICSLDYIRFGNYMVVAWWGEKYNRTISWSDDGSQPDDELLLQISFPTGAYIFGDDYPADLFQKFFTELKSYNPKYIDSVNHALYFSIDNAKNVFNNLDSILEKYREMYKKDVRKRKIREMEEELEKLKKLEEYKQD